MAKKRFYSESAKPNHHSQKYNDKDRSDKDVYPADMYRGPLTDAEEYMGMPTSMRGGLEHSAMIREDHRAIANLPQEVMIKPYPKVGPYLPEDLNDDVSGVDSQMTYDDAQRESHFYPKKI